jgi:hypothetical protein
MFEKLAAIVDRLMNDAAFKEQCQREPAVALAPYQLTGEEAETVRTLVQGHDVPKQIPERGW